MTLISDECVIDLQLSADARIGGAVSQNLRIHIVSNCFSRILSEIGVQAGHSTGIAIEERLGRRREVRT